MNHLKYKKIANPFNIGSCARGEGFFNREEIQKEINFFLHTKAEHHFLIHGQRRIGKTSLLRYIQDTTGPSVYPVYYDLQDNARTPLKKLLKKIAEQIAIDINKPLNITDEEIEAEKFYSIIKQLITGFREGEVILLLFDEFDVLGNLEGIRDDPFIDSFSANRFIPFITHWIEKIAAEQLPVKLILAAGRNYRDLKEAQYGQLLKFGRQKELEYFKRTDVENLLHTLTDNILPFAYKAIDAVYSKTTGHPYFTQALAGESLKIARESKKHKITMEDVNKAFEPAIKAVAGGVGWFWGQFSPQQKILLYIIAHLEEENQIISKDKIQLRAETEYLLPGLEKYQETINQLIHSKILTPDPKNLCSGVMVPFFQQWIIHEVKKQELNSLLLESIDEEMSLHLRMATFYYQKKTDLKKALEFYNRILDQNPYHFESSFYSGKILYQMHKKTGEPALITQAMQRIEICYQSNPVKVQKEWECIIFDLIQNQEILSLSDQTLTDKISKLKKPGRNFQDKVYPLVKQKKILLLPFLQCLEIADILFLTSQEYEIPDNIRKGDKETIIRYLTLTDVEIIKELEKLLDIELKLLDSFNTNCVGYTIDRKGHIFSLGLYGCCKPEKLTSIIKHLKELKNLLQLDLGNNQLNDISSLKDLLHITELHLNLNQLTDISPLAGMEKLTILYLRHNLLSDISPLRKLKKLLKLYLENNKISDITVLSRLPALTRLGLGNNEITEISSLKELINLTKLGLGDNKITDIIILNELKNLSSLNLRNNEIKNLSLLQDLKNLQEFNIEDNPLEEPPKDIADQGIEAIQAYFRQKEAQNIEYLYEAKIMIVGEPGSGKSSLMKKLFNPKHIIPDHSLIATPGIDVQPGWNFYIDQGKEFSASIWDFGGQQIQYMLHQFFLTESCLYILMVEKQKDVANIDYWLNILHILGKKSPVIILFNEIKIESVSTFVFDEKKYRALFPDMEWKRLDINLAKTNDNRLDVLINTIRETLVSLPHVGQVVPAKWKRIRQDLEAWKGEKLMSLENFFGLCATHEITNIDDQLLILKYFHLLGVVLYFADDPRLRETLFLDPNWTTNAIYTVLSDKAIEQFNGVVPVTFMKTLWDKKSLSYIEQARLLNLMLKDAFELCYEHPGKPDHYIIPLLLPIQEPVYDWDDSGTLSFRFQYPFMPKGITSRLMVRLNEIIDNNIVWQAGVLFTWDGAKAKVVERETTREGLKIIDIRLKGRPDKRLELLTILRQEIKKIQNTSFPKLPYYEMVPCTCSVCLGAQEKRFYAYSDLQNLLKKGKTAIMCQESGEILEIRQLYDAVIATQTPVTWPLQEKKEEYFDVFICHNSKDKTTIREITRKLKTAGITSWFDEQNLRPGDSWIHILEKQIQSIHTALVFIGPEGSGPWQDEEIKGFLLKLVQKECRIIPVILPGCTTEPEIPFFLKPMIWVDFRKTEPDPFEQLLFGITGKR